MNRFFGHPPLHANLISQDRQYAGSAAFACPNSTCCGESISSPYGVSEMLPKR